MISMKSATRRQVVARCRDFLSQWGRYLLPIGFLGLFLAFEKSPVSPLFGVAIFLSLVYVVIADFLPSKASGKAIKSSAWDVAYSLGAAVALWLAISFLLSTSKPINVVTSCSMLPALHRGDLVVLQGGQISVPSARAYSAIRPSDIVTSACSRRYYDGRTEEVPCTVGLNLSGQAITQDYSNDIVVYEPQPAVWGLIIHRAFARIEFGNKSFLLTKGDNNQFLDQQGGISAVPPDRVHGKAVLAVPAIGYLKIFLFAGIDSLKLALAGNIARVMTPFESPPGCDYETN